MKEQHAHLFYREGNSDKEYHAHLVKQGKGWAVNFEYGRRGSTLQSGSKTSSPVEFDAAEKTFNKLVMEKTAKGYTPEESGTPYVATTKEDKVSGVAPQLLNAIEEDALAKFINSDRYWMQEKKDGKRMLLRKDGKKVEAINRKGFLVGFPKPIEETALRIKVDSFLLDGEAIGDVLFAFDVLEFGGKDLRSRLYFHRYAILQEIIAGTRGAIHIVSTWASRYDKTTALAWLRGEKAEGVVFKDKDAPYTAGRPASGGAQVKFKFTATASVIVTGMNEGRRSVGISVFDAGSMRAVGNVTIPPNADIPPFGAVVEVRYLYAFRSGGALFQPVYLGQRDDVSREECSAQQLKFKAEGSEEDAA